MRLPRRRSLAAAVALTLSLPAAASAIQVENPEGAPYPDRLVTNRIANAGGIPTHDVATLRIRNDAASERSVTALDVSGPFALEDPPALPLALAPGGSVDVSVRNVAASPGDPQPWLHEGVLTVGSDDPLTASVDVELAGLWQDDDGGANEPALEHVVAALGYGTEIVGPGEDLRRGGRVETVGDEVLAPYWRSADPAEPVRVRVLGEFRNELATRIGWHAEGSTDEQPLIETGEDQFQRLFPRASGGGPAVAEFTPPAGTSFGLRLDEEWSDPAMNPDGCAGAECGEHRVRVWPAEDRDGQPLPGAYLLAHDLVDGAGNGNFDYQDNLLLLENAVPEWEGDIVPPSLAGIAPADGAEGVATDVAPRMTFSEPIAPGSTGDGVRLSGPDGAPVAIATSISPDGRTLTAAPGAPLAEGARYELELTAAITDPAGNPLAGAPLRSAFVTSAPPPADDPQPPAGDPGPAPGGDPQPSAPAPSGPPAPASPAAPAAAPAAGASTAARLPTSCGPVRLSSAATRRYRPASVSLERGQIRETRLAAVRAFRTLVAIEARLDRGLRARDLCPGTFASAKFAAGVELGPGSGPSRVGGTARAARLRVRVPDARPPLTPEAALLNRRLAQASIRRANALTRRLGGRLTGADLRSGALTAAKLRPGLTVVSLAPTAAGAPAGRSEGAGGSGSRGAARPLTLARLRKDHRMALAALRRAERLRALLERGVSGAMFRNRSITSRALSPGLRAAARD